ncbi:CUB and sushi domain-containing protein 3-like [Ptychodera flava]|uniref:CUB and sushi domain-containing protein 3-like n=1 Tax=Ptychodera flava TaxID=63121 RepID=UPI00396A84CC
MDPLCENICNCTEDSEMVCTPMQCDENASCEIHDGIRQCFCNEDCDGNGFSFNGGWGESSACKQECYDPGTPRFGYQDKRYEYPVCSGTLVSFKCTPGYAQIGSPSVTCKDGVWDPIPECESICCDPGTPDNGYQEDSYEYPVLDDSTVYFHCNDGYALHDTLTEECLHNASTTCMNGEWSDPLPQCRLKCNDPGNPDNGEQVEEPDYPVCSGTIVTFSCHDGYTLVGSETTMCQDGEWVGQLPICEAHCEDPGTPSNGCQLEDYEYPAYSDYVVYFCCNDGYALHDIQTKECLHNASTTCEDGQWSDPLPECLLKCDHPGSPENGELVEEIDFPVCTGTDVTFRCTDGYTLVGKNTITCQDGDWSDPIPVCKAPCEDPGTPQDGYQRDDHEYPVYHDSVVFFCCDNGYALHDKLTKECLQNSSTTCVDGDWSDPLPECLPHCEDPGSLENGEIEEDIEFPVCSGTSVTFSCHDGYTLIGPDTTTCQDGEWSHPVPTCTAHCEDPGTPENGHQMENYEYPVLEDSVVYFGCDDGYALHDYYTKECLQNASTTCSNGDWSDPLPECRLKCDDPGSPQNGELVEEIDFPVCTGTDVTFRCTDGYTLVGKNTITCQDGDWSDPIPVCNAPCDDPGTPQDGYQRDDHEYPVHHDSVVFFCCDDGYALHDKLTKECLQNSSTTCVDGEWSDPLPECLPHCEDPGSLENGQIEEDIEFPVCSGTNITFSCHEGYTLIGTHKTSCQNGEWTHPVPFCEPHCEDPGTPENGYQDGNYEYPVPDETVVKFSCNYGYGLKDPETEACVETYESICDDREWSNSLPLCVRECAEPGQTSAGNVKIYHIVTYMTMLVLVYMSYFSVQ